MGDLLESLVRELKADVIVSLGVGRYTTNCQILLFIKLVSCT